MSSVNEFLIRSVFDSMIEQKPSLAKHLIPDDDDIGDKIDHRILADLIIKHFPWPIGVELRRLFSGSMRELNRLRLDQLFKTLERTMQFLAFLMLAQLWEEKRKNHLEIPHSFSNEFAKRINVLTLGNYAWLIRSVGSLFEERNVSWFVEELSSVLNNTFYNKLDIWVPERNEIGHYQINLGDEEIEKKCVELNDRLTETLSVLTFIIKYKLVTVREIKVRKLKYQTAEFEHVIDILNSSDSDFRATELINEVYTDSNSVLFMKDIRNPKEFLNLSPFVIDTRTEVIDSRDKFNLRKDIFLYTKYNNDKLMYLGTEVTEKCDLTILSNYPALVNQFRSAVFDLTDSVTRIQN